MSVFLTGDTGFVGKNFISYFGEKFTIKPYSRKPIFSISEKIVVHLAGKAHDLSSNLNFQEYYEVNYELTKKIFDAFLISNAEIFIVLSSVKAVSDSLDSVLTENDKPQPKTHYGKSKLLAEKYILSKQIPKGKRVYILRPCMIHGPLNKGNLNLLYNIVTKRFPWPLGAFDNKRSFCSVDNLMFIIKELILNPNIASGIYNVSDDISLSTNQVIRLISKSTNSKPLIWKISKTLINFLAVLGDNISLLPLNSERLKKITESYIVSNKKIVKAIGKNLPITSEEGLLNTFKSFKQH